MMDHETFPGCSNIPTRCYYCGVVFPAPENYFSHQCNPLMVRAYQQAKHRNTSMTPLPEDHTQRQVGGSHYKTMKIQPEKYIWENGIPFHEGNVIKYVSRWRTKGGLQDLEKAAHFLDLLIQHERMRADEKEKANAVNQGMGSVLGGVNRVNN